MAGEEAIKAEVATVNFCIQKYCLIFDENR